MSKFFSNSTYNGDVHVTLNYKRSSSTFHMKAMAARSGSYMRVFIFIQYSIGPDSESTDSSVSTCEVKRKRKLNYLCGNSQKEWITTDEVRKSITS